jgi:hypothetical protein
MEQLSNALAISNLGIGVVMRTLDRDYTERFLNNPGMIPMKYPYVSDIIAEYIEKGEWDNMDGLVKKSWNSINLL